MDNRSIRRQRIREQHKIQRDHLLNFRNPNVKKNEECKKENVETIPQSPQPQPPQSPQQPQQPQSPQPQKVMRSASPSPLKNRERVPLVNIKSQAKSKKRNNNDRIRVVDLPKIDDKHLESLLKSISLNEDGHKHIVLTVGNLGYTDLLVNWWLSLNKNTDLSKHSLILTYDNVLVHNLKKKLPFCNIGFIPYLIFKDRPSEKAVAFKKSGWDGITRFKLHAINYLIGFGYTVYYVDPDVYVTRNSLPRLSKLIKSDNNVDILIQQGKPFCSGVIFAPPNDTTMKLFDPKEWTVCNTDDENYIINFFTKKYTNLRYKIATLSLDRFPNGLKWKFDYSPDVVWREIKKGEVDLLHFNYVSGIDNKIIKMRQYKMWHKQMTIINVPKEYQPDLNEICLRKNKSVYPPHQSGPQIEGYCYKYIKEYTAVNTISSNYDYLPVFWTGVALSDDAGLKNKLRDWLKDFMKKYPNRRCWTVVQHCKGIQKTCGIVLPKDWIIFSTSDPNAVKIQTELPSLPSPSQLQSIDYVPLNKRKMMYWHKTGFGRMPDRPIDPHRKIRQSGGNNNITTNVNPNVNTTTTTTLTTENTKNLITIPLLSSVHPLSKKAKWEGSRRILASFIGDINVHPIRLKMRDVLADRKRIIIQSGKYKYHNDIDRFDELMLNSTFALCPRGYGNTSFRLVEAMQYGTIPVYVSDVFSLPYSDVINWNDIAIIVKPEELGSLYQQLSNIESDTAKIQTYRDNIKKLFNDYFTMDGCCKNIVRYITK